MTWITKRASKSSMATMTAVLTGLMLISACGNAKKEDKANAAGLKG